MNVKGTYLIAEYRNEKKCYELYDASTGDYIEIVELHSQMLKYFSLGYAMIILHYPYSNRYKVMMKDSDTYDFYY